MECSMQSLTVKGQKEKSFIQIHLKILSMTDEIDLQWNILTDFLVS